MKAFVTAMALAALWSLPTWAGDDSSLKAATGQVESGAKKFGQGKVGEGVEETAKGIGNTLVEGAKFTGQKLKEAGRVAEPKAKSTWDRLKDGARSFFSGVFSD
jgi:hypothetical protein